MRQDGTRDDAYRHAQRANSAAHISMPRHGRAGASFIISRVEGAWGCCAG